MKKKVCVILALAVFLAMVFSGVCLAGNKDDKTATKNQNNNAIDIENDVGAQVIYAPGDSYSFGVGPTIPGYGETAGVPVENPDGYGASRYGNVPSGAFANYFGFIAQADYEYFVRDWERWNNPLLETVFRVQPVITKGSWIPRWDVVNKLYILPLEKFNPKGLNGIDAIDIGFIPIIKGMDMPEDMPRQAAYMHVAGIAGGLDARYRNWYKANVIVPIYDTWDLRFYTEGYNIGGGTQGGFGFFGNPIKPIATALAGIAGYAEAMNELQGRPGVVFLIIRASNLVALLLQPEEDKVAIILEEKIDELGQGLIDCAITGDGNGKKHHDAGARHLGRYKEGDLLALSDAQVQFEQALRNFSSTGNFVNANNPRRVLLAIWVERLQKKDPAVDSEPFLKQVRKYMLALGLKETDTLPEIKYLKF